MRSRDRAQPGGPPAKPGRRANPERAPNPECAQPAYAPQGDPWSSSCSPLGSLVHVLALPVLCPGSLRFCACGLWSGSFACHVWGCFGVCAFDLWGFAYGISGGGWCLSLLSCLWGCGVWFAGWCFATFVGAVACPWWVGSVWWWLSGGGTPSPLLSPPARARHTSQPPVTSHRGPPIRYWGNSPFTGARHPSHGGPIIWGCPPNHPQACHVQWGSAHPRVRGFTGGHTPPRPCTGNTTFVGVRHTNQPGPTTWLRPPNPARVFHLSGGSSTSRTRCPPFTGVRQTTHREQPVHAVPAHTPVGVSPHTRARPSTQHHAFTNGR